MKDRWRTEWPWNFTADSPEKNQVQLAALLETNVISHRHLKTAEDLASQHLIWWLFIIPKHLQWYSSRIGCNIHFWKSCFSDHHMGPLSQFLLHVTVSRAWQWFAWRTAYHQFNIQEEIPFGDGSVMIWSYCLYDCRFCISGQWSKVLGSSS